MHLTKTRVGDQTQSNSNPTSPAMSFDEDFHQPPSISKLSEFSETEENGEESDAGGVDAEADENSRESTSSDNARRQEKCKNGNAKAVGTKSHFASKLQLFSKQTDEQEKIGRASCRERV